MRINIARTVACAAAAWVIAALLIIWWDTGCFQRFDMACNGRPWAAIKAFITLDWGKGWLYEFQTLIAGILALAGASVVLISSKRERDARAAEAAAQEEAALRSTRVTLAVRCRHILLEIDTLGDATATLEQISNLDFELTRLGFFAPQLTFRIQLYLGTAKWAARNWQSTPSNLANVKENRAVASTCLYLVYTLLASKRRASEDDDAPPIVIPEGGKRQMRWNELPQDQRTALEPHLIFRDR